MADEKEGGHSPTSDLLWLLFFLFIVFVAWFATGGPTRADFSSLFIQSPVGFLSTSSYSGAGTGTPARWFPITYPGVGSGGSTAGAGSSGNTDLLGALTQFQNNPSAQQGSVSFGSTIGARQTDPLLEYIEIRASDSNAGSISLSGWRIQSLRTGRMAVIGTAVETPLTGQGGTPGAVVLQPGGRAVIVSGRSPIGVSFRVNQCSGYLAQFQSFSPRLSAVCPSASSELSSYGGGLSSEKECRSAASQVPPCRVLTGAPSGVSAQCGDFLTRTLTYNGCVSLHRNDPSFLYNEWRIYEGNATELWLERGDTLVLLDQTGHLVSSVSY